VDQGLQTKPQHFKYVDQGYPELKNGQIRLQTLYISVDPYMRNAMHTKSRFAPFSLDIPMYGSGVGRVIESKAPHYSIGDILTSQKILEYPFQEYVVFDLQFAAKFKKLSPSFPKHLIAATIGWLGMPGLTAYFGIMDQAKYRPGENLVVSGAAGAVGSIAGQIGRILGLKVLGIVGNQEKADYITRDLGFHHAIIYKGKSREELEKEISRIFPDGVDIYLDNVGGEISNAVLLTMKPGGRVPVSGQISTYNSPEGATEKLLPEFQALVEQKKLERSWYMVFNFTEQFDKAWDQLVKWEQEGKLKCRETHYRGLESFYDAFTGLFKGENLGKVIIDLI